MDFVQCLLSGRATIGQLDTERNGDVAIMNPQIEDADLQEVAIRLRTNRCHRRFVDNRRVERLEIGDADFEQAPAYGVEQWQFGARGALGAEFWPLGPGFIDEFGAFAIGVVGEVFWDQAFVDDWSRRGTDPGPFDPSGPGWTLGLTTRF